MNEKLKSYGIFDSNVACSRPCTDMRRDSWPADRAFDTP